MSINPKWKWDKSQFIEDCMSMVINRKELESGNIPSEYFTTDDEVFVEKEFQDILFKVFDNFKLSEEFKNKIINNQAIKLIFYAQYFSGCSNLEYARFVSYINISTFISATLNKEICSHKIGYGLMERLQPLSFYVYEKEVFVNCMAKVASISLFDHFNDREEDEKNGYEKSNPFLTGEITIDMCDEFKLGLIDIIQKGI